MPDEAIPKRVAELTVQIRQILFGQPTEVQGAVLINLVSIFVAGYEVIGDIEETRRVRAQVLVNHMSVVRAMVPLTAEIIGTPR